MGNKTVTGIKVPAAIKRMLAGYNMIANVCWPALNLVPVSIFCYHSMAPAPFCLLLLISFLPSFLPRSFLNSMHPSKRVNVYIKTGVRFINRFAQNGDIINTLARKKFPQYKQFSKSRLSLSKALQQTYSFEKFHITLFVFLTAITFYALQQAYYGWAGVLILISVIYTIYPILLRQYIRIRLKLFVEHSGI